MRRMTQKERVVWSVIAAGIGVCGLLAGYIFLRASSLRPVRVATAAQLGYNRTNQSPELYWLSADEVLVYTPFPGGALRYNLQPGQSQPLGGAFWSGNNNRFRISPDGTAIFRSWTSNAPPFERTLCFSRPDGTQDIHRISPLPNPSPYSFAWYSDNRRAVGIPSPPYSGVGLIQYDRDHPDTPPIPLDHPALRQTPPAGRPPYQPGVLGFNKKDEAIAVDFAAGTHAMADFGNAALGLEFYYSQPAGTPRIPEVALLRCKPAEHNPDPTVTRTLVQLRPETDHAYVSLSPDGSHLVWLTMEQVNYSDWQLLLWKVLPRYKPPRKQEAWQRVSISAADGSDLHEVAAAPLTSNSLWIAPTWSIDSREILYFQNSGLYRLRVD